MRFLLNFSYDGSNYKGYQRQPGCNTIQEQLEEAVQKVNNNIKRAVHSSGRTDKKVHAINQYAHVDMDIHITEKQLKRALNSNLPDDIYIKNTYIVDDSFHARYCVKEKEYKYYLNMGEYNPLERNYVYQYNYQLNVEAMKEAIKVFLGEHDFRAFATDSKDKENCVREIYEVSIQEVDHEKIEITFRGNGFLRYQVRNMVGLLLQVGQNKLSTEDVEKILASCDRKSSGKTAPAEGLYLTKVKYKDRKENNIE